MQQGIPTGLIRGKEDSSWKPAKDRFMTPLVAKVLEKSAHPLSSEYSFIPPEVQASLEEMISHEGYEIAPLPLYLTIVG